MDYENISNMAGKDSHVTKRVYFVKTEAKDLTFEEDEDKPRSVNIKFQQPPQIYMDYEGTSSVRNCSSPMEATGLITYLLNKSMFQKMINELKDTPDYDIRGGIEIDLGTHSFYVLGCESKEEIIGLVQTRVQRWQYNLKSIFEEIRGNMNTEGDESCEEEYVHKGVK